MNTITPIPLIEETPTLYSHRTDVQMRFSDVDMFGHINNVVFHHYLDLGKVAFSKGINFKEIGFVMAHSECNFVQPILFIENIEVLTRVAKIGTKSITFRQLIINKESQAIKMSSQSIVVVIDVKTGKSISVPSELRTILENA